MGKVVEKVGNAVHSEGLAKYGHEKRLKKGLGEEGEEVVQDVDGAETH